MIILSRARHFESLIVQLTGMTAGQEFPLPMGMQNIGDGPTQVLRQPGMVSPFLVLHLAAIPTCPGFPRRHRRTDHSPKTRSNEMSYDPHFPSCGFRSQKGWVFG